MEWKLAIDVLTISVWALALGLFAYSAQLSRKALKAQMAAAIAQHQLAMFQDARISAIERALVVKGILTLDHFKEALRDYEKPTGSHLN